MRVMTFSQKIPYRRYAAIAIAGAATLIVLLFVFAEGVALIGTDIIRAPNWKRLDTHQMFLQHQLNKLRSGPHILVFGTSRNNMLSPEYLSRPVINVNYVYGTPRAILKCLRTLDEQQIRNVEKVYMLVDYHTLEKGRYQRDIDHSFIGYLRETAANFTLHRARVAINTIGINLGMPYPYYLSSDGYVVPAAADAHTAFGVPQRPDRNFRFDAVDELRELQRFLAETGIQAVYYTSTLPTKILQAWGEELVVRYMRVLADTVGSHYQLIYVPEISGDERNFSDESHLNGIGYRKLYVETDWNKYLTTPASVEDRIVQLKAALRKN